MEELKKWGASVADFRKKIGHQTTASQSSDSAQDSGADLGSTGRVTWRRNEIDFNLIKPAATERSLFRFKKTLPEFIWNTAALEGNTFTLPEVRTLLDGVTVGGKRIEDANQVLAISEGLNLMTSWVESGKFNLESDKSKLVNGAVAKHEIIDSGMFRGQGEVAYLNLNAALAQLDDARERALAYFASATRSQFYYDGNKRTARIMMTGHLIAAGYEPVSVPFARRLEFNLALDELFRSDDATQLISFLTTCTALDA